MMFLSLTLPQIILKNTMHDNRVACYVFFFNNIFFNHNKDVIWFKFVKDFTVLFLSFSDCLKGASNRLTPFPIDLPVSIHTPYRKPTRGPSPLQGVQ